MRYFTYIADQAFKTSDTGERLFCPSGPWSRPFVIPDADTEQRLRNKQTWMLRMVLGLLIVVQPFVIVAQPDIIRNPRWFFVYFVAVMLIVWAVRKIVFVTELRKLSRAPARLSLRSFHAQVAQRHSKAMLALGLAVCLLFVAAGIWMLSVDTHWHVAGFCIAFFGACACGWGYCLYLKRS